MIRLITLWLPVIVACLTSILCWKTAQRIGANYTKMSAGAVPQLSELYYPDALAIYLYPFFFGVWATFGTVKKLSNEHTIFQITATLGFTLVFLAGWICGMVLPYTSIAGSMR